MPPRSQPAKLPIESFVAILEALPSAVLVMDSGWNIVFGNSAAERLLGFSRAELRTLYIDQLIPEELRDRYRRLREQWAPEADGFLRGERICRSKDGRDVPTEIAVSTLKLGHEEFRVASFVDTSERTHAEETEAALVETRLTLEESEERFQKAFRVSPHPIGITELATGRLIEVNDAFERTFGHTREQAIGKTTTELRMWKNPLERERMVALLSAHGSFRDLEVEGEDSRGRTLHLVLSAEGISLHGMPCLVTYVHDVTLRRAAEQAKLELEQQLRHTQKLDALGTLAGGIAHDFNNILGAILAYSELIKMDIGSPTQIESHIVELRRAGDRARELVKQILTFSRQQPRARRPVRIDLAVRDALNLLRSTLPSTIQIDVRIEPNTPVVLADITQIHQIVLNLGTNAAHAMQNGHGRLRVELEGVVIDAEQAAQSSDLQPRRYARVTVADTGGGIENETLKRVFEPFFTTKAPGEGSGLGLSVVQGIVQEHEGVIRVETEVGHGTRFELYFPEHEMELDDDDDARPGLAKTRGGSVLFIDDEQVLCRSVSRLLERLGYQVTASSDPNEAVELFRQKPDRFDVVLTDLTMPGMTGIDVAREVHRVDPKKPVLVMSGFGGSWTAESLRPLGILDLVPKPLSVERLTRSLARAVGKNA